jgi:hypothetical protein
VGEQNKVGTLWLTASTAGSFEINILEALGEFHWGSFNGAKS